MNLPVIIIGAGGHAKVLINALRLQGTIIIGITDLKSKQAKLISEVPIIGEDNKILSYCPQEILLVNGIGSVGVTRKRQQIFEHFKTLGYSFATIVHPSAIIASDVQLSEGVQIMAGVIIQPGTSIGHNTIVNTRTSVDHDCLIDSHVHLAPGVTLSGDIKIGEGSHIGTGANIIQGIGIGQNCLVAAGALVIRDVPDRITVMGVPAKEIKKVKR